MKRLTFQDSIVSVAVLTGLSEQLARGVLENEPVRALAQKVLDTQSNVVEAINNMEQTQEALKEFPVFWVCFKRMVIAETDPRTCLGLGPGAEFMISKGEKVTPQPREGHKQCGWRLMLPGEEPDGSTR